MSSETPAERLQRAAKILRDDAQRQVSDARDDIDNIADLLDALARVLE